jgi:glucose/mannose transport system permease protein
LAAAKAGTGMKWTRVIVYAALIILALLFLVPLGVVVVNSLRSSREIAATSLIGWPSHLIFTNYGQAWNRFCMAEHCWGIEPYMLNSLTLAIPATIISTLLGALAGYSISLWRFRGDRAARSLADEHHRRPDPDPHRPGHEFHDAVLP